MSVDLVTPIGNPVVISVAKKIRADKSGNYDRTEGLSITAQKEDYNGDLITAEKFIPINGMDLDDSLANKINSTAASVYFEINKPQEIMRQLDIDDSSSDEEDNDESGGGFWSDYSDYELYELL